ncbi:glycosyltransferase [Kordiimonas aestuarii]|uniref:glycosyltransferase n=1 Tax=Kordiimonas aestuarii TaxID=1005925 RepID=UPI0021D12B07|nr:glycosyltransferase family 2 protein [Kordiimonas aestuarii]
MPEPNATHVPVSVVLATYNGGARLDKTLDSMTRLKAPDAGWELIVVDNGSTDETPDVLKRYENQLPMTVLHNPIQGKNTSLNVALQHTGGGLIVFTDDDVLVPADWLLNYITLASRNPDYDVFGGRIVPDWPAAAPSKTILEGVSVGDAFAVHDATIPDGEINPGKIWGPNMAVRQQVFKEGHRFNEGIGPSGANYIPGSESSFNLMLAQMGYHFYFDNNNAVKHQIRPEQLTKKWLKGRAFRLGRGQVHWSRLGNEAEVARIGIFPRWYFSYMIRHLCLWVLAIITFSPVRLMASVWHMQVARGMFFEQYRLSSGSDHKG